VEEVTPTPDDVGGCDDDGEVIDVGCAVLLINPLKRFFYYEIN
jgi:hypothetical protein